MDRAAQSLEIRLERSIAAAPEVAYADWLDPKVPGTPWNFAGKLVMDAKEDGLFYARMNNTPHYGMFTKLEPGREIEHTWMSPYTEGQETRVTVTFRAKGSDTLMTLVHAGLPTEAAALGHQKGWTQFMDAFPAHFS